MQAPIQHHVTAIIAAGGSGQRLGFAGGKQLLEIDSMPVVAWTLKAVARSKLVDDVVVVCDPERVAEYATAIGDNVDSPLPIVFVAGGATRELSVRAGLSEAKGLGADIVVVHDGARPLVSGELFDRCIERLIDEDAAGVVLGHPSVDTLKIVHPQTHSSADTTSVAEVVSTPDRKMYWDAQTPQVFWHSILEHAYEQAENSGFVGTDDSSYVERMGERVLMIEGPRSNIKITVPEDIEYATHLLMNPERLQG